jgi:hypothetical protein
MFSCLKKCIAANALYKQGKNFTSEEFPVTILHKRNNLKPQFDENNSPKSRLPSRAMSSHAPRNIKTPNIIVKI